MGKNMLNTSISKRFLSMFLLCIPGLVLQGCGSKADCNDSDVKKNAIEIIQEYLNKENMYRGMNAALSGTTELTSIKTLSRDNEVKRAQCSANYSFTYNEKPREVEVVYDLAYLQDKGETEVKVAAINHVVTAVVMISRAEPPIKNGIEKITDPKTGNVQHLLEWKNGVQDGVEKIYNPTTGKLIAEIHIKNGNKAGSEKRWNEDGSILLIDLNWIDGKATGIQKQYDSSGTKLIIDLTFKDGAATGLQTTGNLDYNFDEFHYKDGVYDGIHKKYLATNLSGKMYVSKVENFKNGKLDGKVQEFDDAGKIIAENNFKNGIEVSAGSTLTSVENTKLETCIDLKAIKYRNEQGAESLISEDMMKEWRIGCTARSEH